MSLSRNLRLSDEAINDIDHILQHSFETRGSPQQDEYASALHSAFEEITMFPEIGQSVRRLSVGMRKYRVRQRVIYYILSQSTDEVMIARILHFRMDARRHI
jgi:plasmid stabilization system protein ParE